MKRRLCIALLLVLACVLALTACGDDHIHNFGDWVTVKKADCTNEGTNERYCSCGEKQTQNIAALGHNIALDPAITPTCTIEGKTEGKHCSTCFEIIVPQVDIDSLGHIEVIDSGVAATCTSDGKTEGKHCSRCAETLVSQTVINKLGHIEVIDPGVAATCTSDGKTEGKHCSRCAETLVSQTAINKLGHIEVVDSAVNATCTSDGKTAGKHCGRCNTELVAQMVVPSKGHQYNNGEITSQATCIKTGIKTFVCTVNGCGHSYTENYSLPTYTATELYNNAVAYVGEIITYDKNGDGLALATGFVISSDGKIVTNYHVIEDAYYAEITINDKKYSITHVLAYDENIDLAVLKINATGLTAASICKNPVSVGATVYAIGSSRGMTNTYSQGIITYADRVVDGVHHLQHDASITHGNSGGPLINVYGEVIGINTWGISDSQNLNFAVFAAELDNLIYGTPLTLAEFYNKECNAFEKLKNYIVDNGTYNESNNNYVIVLGITYSSDYTNKYTRIAYYYADENIITLDFLINDGEYWVYFEIDENLDGSYYWSFFDEYNCRMSGTLYAATYDGNTLLGYSSTNMTSSSLIDSTRRLASLMIDSLCTLISYDLKDINVTAKDLGFYNY